MENVIAIYPYDHAQLDFVFDDWGNEIENAFGVEIHFVIDCAVEVIWTDVF